MFGAICSGRPVQVATQVEATKYVISVNNAANISHVAIFLLPQTEFTDASFTALVYFQLPNSPEFKLLGGINPIKPSAIYKLNNNSKQTLETAAQVDDIDMNVDAGEEQTPYQINIGISIEPTPQAEALLLQEKSKQMGNSDALVRPQRRPILTLFNPNDVAALANKIVSHAYNYLGRFVDSAGMVPMKAFDSWWDKFRRKLASNPSFLDELQEK